MKQRPAIAIPELPVLAPALATEGFQDKAGLTSDPDLAGVRSDPRFAGIVKKLG